MKAPKGRTQRRGALGRVREEAACDPRIEVVRSVTGGPSSGEIVAWTVRILKRVARRSRSVSILLCGDRKMRNLNRVFLDKDRPTDVLSFPSGDSPERPFLGDLAVDLAVAQRQARRLGHSVEREIQILLTHGLLHLLGHDHETDRGEMFSLQSRVVRQLFGTGPDGVPDEIGEETR